MTASVISDPNTTVDGHPARTSSGIDGGSGLQLFNVNGVYLEMLTHSQQATAQLHGGLVGTVPQHGDLPRPGQLALSRAGEGSATRAVITVHCGEWATLRLMGTAAR